MSRIGGKDVNVNIGGLLVQFASISITITDNRAVAKTSGVPNGYVDGDASAAGEVEVDTANFNLIIEAAKKAGSFKDLEPWDVVFNAETARETLNIEAFGCLFKISDLLNADSNGTEVLKHKLPFDVTDKDFIRINGVPYLKASETENLV